MRWDESLELVAAELQVPLELIRISAAGLAKQLQASAGDPDELAAAETLIQSAEKMHRIVQALIEASRGDLPEPGPDAQAAPFTKEGWGSARSGPTGSRPRVCRRTSEA
jgi:nitrogen fixation/metabolism regulation signal transduction histidine kinase